ncbi:MAG: cbb3-type cytochrome c oxidase subunit I [Actinomycetota bacterium]|nr:cbb3-type cytochrome c oxidase subunit I [Actinomycetota bacterium]
MTRRIVGRYLVASTVILLASGLLGILIRESQAGIATLHNNTWYALMTAHGLGSFLGWAGFAVMGLSFWALEEAGFELRPVGRFFAEATWWLMVLGVAGVLVSTLALHFGGSWVFLYPLPFHGAGQWGKWATGIFAFSVLLAGLSIVTWCLSILHTVVGPALHAVRSGIGNRLGVALGLGYLWPKRFATNPRSVPYAVIPLTVIGIDMIVATLPLAVLLVEMIVQAFSPGVHVDPLLAKNVLWFFGHPVVYLLLFPAVAVYYTLVPKLAGRPLVAGNVIAVAWAIAVVANVTVWAHHVYIDYPDHSQQATINVLMQPTTFALVIPSALSLYSLGLTIYRSDWQWGVVETTLFLGLFSWLTAGLSGVVNATIAFDKVVHNTLWIVGHFHQMAIVNIGFVVFAGIYYVLPNVYGKPLWSEALGKWHVWLTFVGVTVNSGFWLWQGLNGAPRRFAQLPSGYEASTRAALPFVAMIGVAQVLFVVNMVQTLRGVEPRTARAKGDGLLVAVEASIVLLAVLLAAGAGAAGFFLGRASAGSHTKSAAATPPTSTASTSAGKDVFASAGCGGCHTLRDAGSTGTAGPSLDQARPPLSLIVDRVTHGKGGMPAFTGQLSGGQIRAVAKYVASVAGR